MTSQQPPHPAGGRSRPTVLPGTWSAGERTREVSIADLELFLVEFPSAGLTATSRSVVVRLACDAGPEGWGEAVLNWRPSELPSRRDTLLPVLGGRSVFQVASLMELDTLDSPALRAAVETAVWDLIGQAAGQPLAHLWGGMYRSRVPLAARLPHGPADRTAQLARELADQGFHTQIIGTSNSPDADRACVAEVRAAAGDRAELRFDAAGRYDAAEAAALCVALETSGVRYCLDPIASGAVAALAALRTTTSLPLAVSIGATGARHVVELVCAEAVDGVVISPDHVGGLLEVRRAAAVADAAGLTTSLAVGARGGIALAAALHLAAATPSFVTGNETAYPLGGNDLLTVPLETSDGMVTVPPLPGLGITVDRNKLERWSIG